MSKIQAMISGRGGTGKSVIAGSLSMRAAAAGEKVLVVDLSVGMRCQDELLGYADRVVYDIMDISDARMKSRKVILSAVDGRPDLLPAAQTRSVTELNKERLTRLLERLRESYDRILLDVPAGWNLASILAAEAADEILIIETPDRIGFRCLDRIRSLVLQHRSDVSVRLILNRYRPDGVREGRQMDIAEIREMTGLDPVGWIPEDNSWSGMPSSSDTVTEECEALKALNRINRRLNGETVAMEQPNRLTDRNYGFLARFRRHS